jgi:hypothetical protein
MPDRSPILEERTARYTAMGLYLTLLIALLMAPIAPLHAVEPASVQLNGQQCIRVNHRPFFPIGIYSASTADFPSLADAGFNVVHSYGWDHKSNAEVRVWGGQFLDAAAQHGLMALVGMNRDEVAAEKYMSSAERVLMFRDHPAVLAWHTMDEPGAGVGQNDLKEIAADAFMPGICRVVKENDSHHPVTAVVCRLADHERFTPSMDVHQADYYPIPPFPAGNFVGTGFAGIAQHSRLVREASGGAKPLWFVCQAFDYALYQKDKDVPAEWQRFPTREELRTMSYTAVASGARGIFYWSMNELRKLVREGQSSTDYWQRLSSVTRELHELAPVLAAETPETFLQQDNVVALIKSDGRDLYIIAANYERKPTKTVLQVPGIVNASAQMVFGEGTAPVVEGKLTLSLDGIESRVYRVSK